MAKPIQEGSLQYYANELKISKPTVQKLGKEECAKRLKESRKIENVIMTPILEVCDSTKTNSMIEEIKDLFSSTSTDSQKAINEIEAIKLRLQMESVSYLSLFITGKLPKGERDSMRANICLKYLKAFSKKTSTKPVKKASITNKTRTLTTEIQEEKILDLDNEG